MQTIQIIFITGSVCCMAVCLWLAFVTLPAKQKQIDLLESKNKMLSSMLMKAAENVSQDSFINFDTKNQALFNAWLKHPTFENIIYSTDDLATWPPDQKYLFWKAAQLLKKK